MPNLKYKCIKLKESKHTFLIDILPKSLLASKPFENSYQSFKRFMPIASLRPYYFVAFSTKKADLFNKFFNLLCSRLGLSKNRTDLRF